MQLNKTEEDSLGQYSDQRTQISLSFKPFIMKAYSLFVLISLIAGIIPTQANAGFFSTSDAQAVDIRDIGTDDYNSQNVPLWGTTSVDPNAKSVNETPTFDINGGALLPDTGLVGSGLESVSSGGVTTYEVKEGDTLSEIAELYDVSINTIKWENNLTSGNIKIGQKLDILPVTGVKHIIKKGDNLDKIAAKYDAEVEDIMVFNDITKSSTLKAGEILYVPNGIIKPVVAKPSVKKPVSSGSNTRSQLGYYIRPANGAITSSYGSRRRGFHYGVDIGVSRGTPVVAAASGVVVNVVSSCVEGRSSCGGRYGNYITIEHPNGTFTRYAHLSRVSVSVGEQVSQGERIGLSGNTGRSTGPHLHFEIENANGSKMRPPF
jgi:murein DD-endopeptidase MepM/ murein hydrolase activator NlpD